MKKLATLIVLFTLLSSLVFGQVKLGGNAKLGGTAGARASSFSMPSSFTWEQVPGTPDYVISIARSGTKIFAGTRSGLPTTYIGGAWFSDNGGTWTKVNAGLKSRISICSDWPSPCSAAPTGGTFTLSYNGQTTSALAFNASNATIQSALEGLSTIGSGNVVLSDGPLGQSATIAFQGARANDDPTDITLNPAGLTGTTPGGMIRGPRFVAQLWATPSGALLATISNNLSTDLYQLPAGSTTWQAVPTMVNAGILFDYDTDASGNILAVNVIISGNVTKSTDDGATFSTLSTIDAACLGDDSRPMSIHRAATSIAPDNTIFVGPHNDAVHYSTDGGATWTCMGASSGTWGGNSFIRINSSGQPLVGGQGGQLFLHTGTWASPTTWTAASPGFTSNPPTHDLIKLVNNDMILHAQRPYRSTDGGANWTLDDAGLPAGTINNYDTNGGTFSTASHTLLIGPDKKLYLAVVNQVTGWGIYRTTATVVP